MRNVRVRRERVGGEGEGFECGVEVGNTVLCQQADEVQAAEWELAGWVLGAFQIAECVCAGVCLWVLVRKRRVEGREYVL